MSLVSHFLIPSSQTASSDGANKSKNPSQHSGTRAPGLDRINPTLIESYGKLPIGFEINRGQTNSAIKFLARGKGYGLFLTSTGAVLRFLHSEQADKVTDPDRPNIGTLNMRFTGARSISHPVGLDPLSAKSNYFIGNKRSGWHTNVPLYSKVRYENIYPGIDLVYYGNQRELEYDLIVAPGKSPSLIRMKFEGTEKISVDTNGDLSLTKDSATIRHRRPFVYQEIEGVRHEVEAAYVIERDEVGFKLGPYDKTKPLNIDPVLVFSGFLGGTSLDQGLAIAVDSQGSTYLTGSTTSTNFPLASPLQGTKDSFNDAFVVKLNPAGNALVYATYLGANGDDVGNSIAVDAQGNAYVTGVTGSGSFPTTGGVFQTEKDGFTDAFAVKLNPSGSALLYSTFIGGDNNESGLGIAVDGSNRAVVVGRTDSTRFRFIPFPSPRNGHPVYQSSNGGALWSPSAVGLTASVVTCLTQDPTAASTFYAGTNVGIFKTENAGSTWSLLGSPFSTPVIANAIVIDPSNTSIIYAATTSGVFKSTNAGQSFAQKNNGFLAVNILALAIDPHAPSILYAGTQVGVFKTTDGGDNWVGINIGTDSTRVNRIVVDPTSTPASTIYLGMQSRGMLKTTNGGALWTQINNGLASFAQVTSLAIDPVDPLTLYASPIGFGDVVFKTTNGGASWSPSGNGLTITIDGQVFPANPSSLVVDPINRNNVYAATSIGGIYKSSNGGATWSQSNSGFNKFSATAVLVDQTNSSRVLAATTIGNDAFAMRLTSSGGLDYLKNFGGDENDEARAVAIDDAGDAYIVGSTSSINLPVANAFQPTYGGFGDAFVAKLNSNGPTFNYLTYLGGISSDQGRGIAIRNGSAYVTGLTQSANFPMSNALKNTLINFDQDAFITRVNPAGNGLDFSTFFGGQGIDQGSSIAVDGNGNVFISGTTSSPDFPVVSAPQPVAGGVFGSDAFVSKLNPSGSAISYSTYLGGSATEQGNGIAVDASGEVYVIGTTQSINFPTVNSLQPFGGSTDVFVAKLGASADLVVTINGTPASIHYGSNLTYTITVTNSGEIPAENVTLKNTVLSGTGIISINTTKGTCSGNRVISCSLATLNPGATATITLVVLPPAIATMTDNVVVTSNTPDSNQTDNSATLNTSVLFTDLMLKNTSALKLSEIGGTNTYIVTVTNKGPSTATGITVTNNLPPQTTFVACNSTSGVCGGSGNNRTVNVPTLAAGASFTATISALINNSVTAGTVISDTASVVSAIPDINPNNDAQTALTTAKAASGPIQNGLIAFSSDAGTGISGANDIYITNSDGTGQTNITADDAQDNRQPVWSPDGTKIAYIGTGNPVSGVWVMNADGTGKAPLTDPRNSLNDQSPTWSPDGTRIAFGGLRDGGSFGVYVVNTDGTQLKKLVNGNDPSWSPDGTRIAFGNGFGIGMMFADGSDVRTISLPRVPFPGMGWSPDSSKLVISLPEDQGFERSLYIVNADGTGLQKINNTSGAQFPSWSPDGTKILFTMNTAAVGPPGGCFFINLDGTGLTKVNGALPNVNFPSWQRRPANSVPLPPTVNISGRVTNATDGSGVPISLTLSGTQSRTTQASFNGDYSFFNVPSGGNYTVTPVLFGNTTANPTNRTFNNLNANQTNADFVITFQPRPPVTGTVKDFNGVPLSGVRVGVRNSIPDTDVFTDSNGAFSFSSSVFLGAQAFLICFPEGNFANYTFEPVIIPIQTLSGNNFIGRPRTASISGKVTVGGVGQGGVPVFTRGFQSLSTTSDQNGNYTISGVGEGSTLQVEVSTQIFPFTPTSHNLTVNGQITGINFVAPLNQFLISGQVTNGTFSGIDGATVTLSGSATATTQTSNNGHFSFGPLPGNLPYSVSVTKPGFTFQAPVANVPNLTQNTQLGFTAFPNTLQFFSTSTNVSLVETDGSVSLTVVRTGFLTDTVKINFRTNNGTATHRTDYTATLGTLTFAPQEQAKTIVIPVNDDSYVEGDESFTVTLTNTANGFVGDQGTAVITIEDDDTAAPTVNHLDSAPFFVRQHYHDFLNRVPDTSGLTFWSEQITDCGIDTRCKEVRRINVSAAFFLSIEFQETGYLVERLYKTAYGDAVGVSNFGPTHQLPVPILRFDEFLADTQTIGKNLIVGQTGWEQVLENNKVAFGLEFVSRQRFLTAFPTSLTPDQFVDQLFAHTGVTPVASDRALAINEFGGAANTTDNAARARALRRVAENPVFKQQESNRAFVLMQYFGYLRRNPNDPQDTDYTGYDFWLSKLNQFNGNFINAEMVKAFIDSREYRERFGP
jgi:uncharacterized repeat protein (TIGR01451 family)